MLALICFFMPGLLALEMENMLTKKEAKKGIINYGTYNFLINLFTVIICVLVLKIDNNIEYNINLYPGIAVKYMVVSSLVTFVLVICKIVLNRNVVIDLEVKNKKNH